MIQKQARQKTESDYLQVRLDSKTKSEVEEVLGKLGLSMTEAVRMYFKQIVMKRAIPFEIKLIEELSDEEVESVGKGLEDIKNGRYVEVNTKKEFKNYFDKLNKGV